jgi:hypothetical protein
VGNEKSELQPIKVGVLQGSVLGPTLYVLYTSDLPTSTNTTLGTVADDTVILSVNEDSRRPKSDLQHHLNTLKTWFEKWRIRINENKTCSITFTLRKSSTPDVTINDIKIPQKNINKIFRDDYIQQINMEAAYSQETKTINITIKQLDWLLGRKSNIAIENKLLIYKTIIIPIWTYGMELWVCASKFNISIIQRSQSKILKMIVDAPWCVSNATLQADLGISNLQDVVHQKCNKHHTRLEIHENPLLKTLLLIEENRGLKRNRPIDLI